MVLTLTPLTLTLRKPDTLKITCSMFWYTTVKFDIFGSYQLRLQINANKLC